MTWNPLDDSLLTSSLLAEGPDVVATWSLFICSADRYGETQLTVSFVASLLRISDDRAQKAFDVLASPDPRSRNKEHEGRRIVPLPDGGWIVVSHAKYREKASRMAAAERQQRYLERMKARKREPGDEDED